MLSCFSEYTALRKALCFARKTFRSVQRRLFLELEEDLWLTLSEDLWRGRTHRKPSVFLREGKTGPDALLIDWDDFQKIMRSRRGTMRCSYLASSQLSKRF